VDAPRFPHHLVPNIYRFSTPTCTTHGLKTRNRKVVLLQSQTNLLAQVMALLEMGAMEFTGTVGIKPLKHMGRSASTVAALSSAGDQFHLRSGVSSFCELPRSESRLSRNWGLMHQRPRWLLLPGLIPLRPLDPPPLEWSTEHPAT
jgi:hypothetical protein